MCIFSISVSERRCDMCIVVYVVHLMDSLSCSNTNVAVVAELASYVWQIVNLTDKKVERHMNLLIVV